MGRNDFPIKEMNYMNGVGESKHILHQPQVSTLALQMSMIQKVSTLLNHQMIL